MKSDSNTLKRSLDRKVRSHQSQSLRVLLAAPDSQGREALKTSLLEAGIDVNCVESGRDCVHIALASEFIKPYDLVLASLSLRDLDGVSLTLLLRDNGYAQPIATLADQRFYLDEAYSKEVGANQHFCLSDPEVLSSILFNCAKRQESCLAHAA